MDQLISKHYMELKRGLQISKRKANNSKLYHVKMQQ